jgi:simple sugar transport system ATP-binding protein
MVHQHFMLIGPLTVTENVILGLEQSGLRLGLAEHAERLIELSRSFGFDIEPSEPVWKLPMGMQQRVEILKLLYRNVDILILDEPTSVLTPSETGPFFEVLGRLKEAGKTILFITHKLEEVMAVADEVTVMRDGRVTAELQIGATNPRELARLMVGRDVVFDISRSQGHFGPARLTVEGLRAQNDRGLPALDDVGFEVRAGEILGIAGVDGNGQAELADAIAGLRPIEAGRVLVGGADATRASVAERKHGFKIGYVPEDRQVAGLDLNHSVTFNLILRSLGRLPFSRVGILDFKTIRAHAERLTGRYDVRLRDIEQEVRFLSGGNQQKIILAREIEDDPEVLIVAQPCKGLDVGAIEFVQNTLLDQREKGVAILYISTELEHIMAVCDRIAVMSRGRITGILKPEEATPERLGMLMAGATADAA